MKNKLSLFTLVGLILGIIFGLLLPGLTPQIKFIGTYYITILKYMVVPVVITTISVSIFNSTKLKSKLVFKTLLVFVSMFTATFLLSSLLVTLINPSNGFVLVNEDWSGNTSIPGILGMLGNLIPKDLKKFATGGNLFTVILIAVVLGYVCSKFEKGEKVINVIDKIKEFLFKVLGYYMYVTPFAVFSLISNTIVEYGPIVLGVGAKYILTAYICAIGALLVVMILPILLITKMSPITFIKKVYKIWMITLSTCSSAASIPTNLECAKNIGVSEDIADTMIPLGTSFHKDGSVIGSVFKIMFLVYLFGATPSLGSVIATALLATLLVTAVPVGGGTISEALILSMMGFPIEALPILTIIATIIDPPATLLNVVGDTSSSMLVARVVDGKKWMKN